MDMNEELSRELETAIEMLEELYDSLKEVFSAVNDYIKELSKKLKEYFNSSGKNDNGVPVFSVATIAMASQIIRGNASYALGFNKGKFIALILSFHLKIPPINRLQWGGV